MEGRNVVGLAAGIDRAPVLSSSALSDIVRVMLIYTQFTDADRERGGGMVFTNSGYSVTGGMAGNVVLAFSVDGR